MPKYKLPPLPKPKKAEAVEMVSGGSGIPGQYDRTIRIPVNDDILDALKVGDRVTVELVGEVTGTRNSESKSEMNEYTDKNIEVMVSMVSAYARDEDREQEDEGMESGYREG